MKVRFDSLVNWKFKKNNSLKSWLKTRDVLESMLKESYGRIETRHFENLNALGVNNFLSSLPTKEQCDLNVVYLACHQNREGQWEFQDGSFTDFSQLQSRPSKVPLHPNRVLILDVCYSKAAKPSFANCVVFASGLDEETFEVNVKSQNKITVRCLLDENL